MPFRCPRAVALIATAASLTIASGADARVAGLELTRVGTFREPVQLAAPPGDRDRLFVVERRGLVRVVRGGRTLRQPFLDLRRGVGIADRWVTSDHGGLLSLTFAPGYRGSGRLYVLLTRRDGTLRVEEYRTSRRRPGRALRSSRRTLLTLPNRSPFDIGGTVAFGPDRLLYVSLGYQDGDAQDLGDLRGKLLRVDPRGDPYRVPASNPFTSTAGARPEVFAYGLRSPWRFSFSPGGHLIVADVGQERTEEINFLPAGSAAGSNLGWDVFEGRRRTKPGAVPAHVPPTLTYSHAGGRCAVVGGHVVTDRSMGDLIGRYLYSDHCGGLVRSVRLSRAGARGDRSEGVFTRHPVSFGLDGLGRSYLVSLDGGVFRLSRR